jgi:hypothetical protein
MHEHYLLTLSTVRFDDQIQTPEAIADNLDELGRHDSAEFMRNELDHQIKLALVDVMKVRTLTADTCLSRLISRTLLYCTGL